MSSSRNIVVSGVIAAVVAFALIGAFILIPGISHNGTSSNAGLSVLMTDPPTVPNGTTDIYMSYNKMGVHIEGDGNQSQYWDILAQSGTIDLMKSINVSETLGFSSSLPQGRTYNAIGFNISNVVVTYNGVNYTADLVYGHNKLFVPIPGGISISSNTAQAVMIDMTPKVLLLGSPQSPIFAFLPAAEAFVVPSGQVPAQAHVIGSTTQLQGYSWWQSYVKASAFAITGVKLSANMLQINVSNTGNTSIVFRIAAVTSGISTAGGYVPPLPSSAVFYVEPNGTLALASGSNKNQFYQQLQAGGYLVAPHTTMTFTYTGTITIGALQFSLNPLATQSIVSGNHYIVRLIGADHIAAAATQSA